MEIKRLKRMVGTGRSVTVERGNRPSDGASCWRLTFETDGKLTSVNLSPEALGAVCDIRDALNDGRGQTVTEWSNMPEGMSRPREPVWQGVPRRKSTQPTGE